MHAAGPGYLSPHGRTEGYPVRDGWDIATVVAEFDVTDQDQATEVARLLFAAEEVLTVRVGGTRERSVYRVDVPRGDPSAHERGAAPAVHAAQALDIGFQVVRLSISADGLGDPEGSPPPADTVPWSTRRSGEAP